MEEQKQEAIEENGVIAERDVPAIPPSPAPQEDSTAAEQPSPAQDVPDAPPSEDTAAAAAEAILFALGEAVELSALGKALALSESAVKKALAALEKKYASKKSGLQLVRLDRSVQLTTKPALYPYLIRIAGAPKKLSLSDTLLETLSIIAYKQPITRAEIESIRGVNSDFAVNKLLGYDLVKELGRKDAPGRPLLFGTTEQFLRSFGVGSLSDLPSLSTVQVEEFKEEAEKEVETRLQV